MEIINRSNIHTKVNVCHLELKKKKNCDLQFRLVNTCSFNKLKNYVTLQIDSAEKSTPAAILFCDVWEMNGGEPERNALTAEHESGGVLAPYRISNVLLACAALSALLVA